MVFNDTLNTKNLFTEFGLVIQTGTAELLAFPERKESLSNDWREENGGEYDLAMIRFKDKEVNLNCAILADNDDEFWDAYNSFFDELAKDGWQTLYIDDHTKDYKVHYLKTSSFKKSSKRLKNVPKVFVKFILTLKVQF